MSKYLNRRDAGVVLAEALRHYTNQANAIILALPRGGVPVAYEVAKLLRLPLDIYIVRKLGVPGQNELAMGAIAQGGVTIFNDDIITEYGVTQQEIDAVTASEYAELKRREKAYRGRRPFPDLNDKIVILIDDGIATGASIKAALQAIRKQKPMKVIAAVPVADSSVQQALRELADDFVCPLMVEQLSAVGSWYDDFSQTEDAAVRDLLSQAVELVK